MTAVSSVVEHRPEGTVGAVEEADGTAFLTVGNRTEGTGGAAMSTTDFCTLSASSLAAEVWFWRSTVMLGDA